VLSALFVSLQLGDPDEQSIFPVLHGSFPHEAPALHDTQAPLLHTLPDPHALPVPQSLSPQSTFPSQSSSLPLPQSSCWGLQVTQAFFEASHPRGHGSVSDHAPSGVHVCTAFDPHLLAAGLHTPVHIPSPLQTKSQRFSGSHVPIGLHASGVWFAPHRRLPGMHEPPHEPLEQTFMHAAPLATHWPFSSHTCGVSMPVPAQRLSPGLHSPSQTPWPVQALGQGGAGVHSPVGEHASGV
jgi:hypothetical protein